MKRNSTRVGKFSGWGAMLVSLYLHNHKILFNTPYSIVFRSRGAKTFSLITRPKNARVKSYNVSLVYIHTILTFGIWPISVQSFILTNGDIAQIIHLLKSNLVPFESIFPSHSYQRI